MRAFVRACVRAYVRVRMIVRARVCTFVRVRMIARARVCAFVRVRMIARARAGCARARACEFACMRAHVRACVHACVRACACVPACPRETAPSPVPEGMLADGGQLMVRLGVPLATRHCVRHPFGRTVLLVHVPLRVAVKRHLADVCNTCTRALSTGSAFNPYLEISLIEFQISLIELNHLQLNFI